jgi:hypothetical protein
LATGCPASVDQAYIELGGLRMGYTESAWAETVNSISSYGSHTWGGLYYGYQQRALIQYNFSSNGCSAPVPRRRRA